MARPTAERRRRRGRRRGPAPLADPPVTPEVIAPEPAAPPPPLPEPLVPEPEVAEAELDLPLATPEPVFATRVLPLPPPPPLPTARRAVFFDVENTSRAEHVGHMIEHLAIDRAGRRTEFVAVGNWRVIGPDTARLLAHHGAQLVHSAPATGVRDWSDLRIAVSAGVWLAGARAGDMLEIVSDDRAFDAVGDVAVSLGIAFRRISYRAMAGAPAATEEAPALPDRPRRDDRRGRHRRRREPPAHAHPALARHAPPPEILEGAAGAHTAPHDEVVDLVRELVSRAPGGSVLIDTVANALKTRGFSRPPGSPRLITRLRRMRELSVSPNGMIRLVGGTAGDGERPPAPDMAARVETAVSVPVEAVVPADVGTPVIPGRRRRSRRRGGRRRRRPGPPPAGSA
ncbi:MAG TPA: hypothetical protein VLG10_12030 [Methylomirabilota bacterium]|nr:hypothetical protein [Methylomirabilota bacterium]